MEVPLNKTMGLLAVVAVLAFAGSAPAHHSIVRFDTTKAVRVKGTVFQFHLTNPHTFIYLDETLADGRTRRWAVEGPAARQLRRQEFADDVLKPGDVIEVCGYVLREDTTWQITSADPSAPNAAGRLLNAELLVMPGGQEQSWGDYGAHKCFAPGHTDQHSK